ncbi:hypothetical protein [Desulfosporosinus sp.]|uniref:hypothetical protein n=1 Tax=Desulfosporosinus sp. TaxID=157907 RepID=UPI0025C418A8|nr:hypothetical protein [Desulfosporosinus sp.]
MFKIIRVLKTTFHTTKDNIERLFACNRTSAHVWNDSLEFAKEHFQKTGRWIDRGTLHLATKGQYPSTVSPYRRYTKNLLMLEKMPIKREHWDSPKFGTPTKKKSISILSGKKMGFGLAKTEKSS